MPRYRVTMEFDLIVKDEDQAKRVAAEYLRQHATMSENRGEKFVSSFGASPEVASHEMAQHDRATATTVAVQLLAWGLRGQQGWVDVAHVNLSNEPMDESS